MLAAVFAATGISSYAAVGNDGPAVNHVCVALFFPNIIYFYRIFRSGGVFQDIACKCKIAFERGGQGVVSAFVRISHPVQKVLDSLVRIQFIVQGPASEHVVHCAHGPVVGMSGGKASCTVEIRAHRVRFPFHHVCLSGVDQRGYVGVGRGYGIGTFFQKPCPVQGRIDVAVYETSPGFPADSGQLLLCGIPYSAASQRKERKYQYRSAERYDYRRRNPYAFFCHK